MFTALRKLISHNENQAGNAPPGMQTMAQSLQKKFSKGVQYNMKIIIKGDRNVGKTCLFYRLQGLKFKEEYMPTQEIQVTSIQWNYKATDDVVKVEVWDVVDKGKKKKRMEGLKLDNSVAEQQVMEEAALDAEFVDVYKNTNGVILMIDMTKHWTFDYVQREVPKVPPDIPVLVFANHRDMGHHRVTTEDDVRFFIEGLDRPPDAAPIRYMEGSMRNGFGLKFLHKFFNLPFLQLQKRTLLQQLDTNRMETELTINELDFLHDFEEQNYDLFMEALNNKRRQIAEQLSPTCSPASQSSDSELPNGLPMSQSTHQVDVASSKSIGDKPMSRSKSSPCCAVSQQMQQQSENPETAVEARVASPLAGVSGSSAASTPPPPPNTFMSRLFKKGPSVVESQSKEDSIGVREGNIGLDGDPVESVDDFVPDDHLDRSFLEDDRPGKVETEVTAEVNESDSEEEGNPMVAGFQDDLDPDDSFLLSLAGQNFKPSGEDEEEEASTSRHGESSVAIEITHATPVMSQVDQLRDGHWSGATENTANISADAFRLEMSGEDEEDSVTDAVPVIHSLEFEDLSILENSGLPNLSYSGSSNLQTPRRLSDSSNGKSLSDTTTSETKKSTRSANKPHKDKKSERRKDDDNDKVEDRRSSAKKKHKKHRVKDTETKTKKSSSSKKVSSAIKTSDNELEDFLNDGGGSEIERVVGRTSTVVTTDSASAHYYESL